MTTLLILVGVAVAVAVFFVLVKPIETAIFLGRMAGKAHVKWEALLGLLLDPKRRPICTQDQLVAEAANVIERQAEDRVATILAFRAALKAERERTV
ncbi:hypothetical protein G3I13_01715 [Streptomyces sp. SID6673]|nr:hypothetical protein [Streptomyces sp. SID11726]NDZ94878.1 hypothetical protein [Streptomyces sp. SID11726]NEB23038.1 hypothetical protein [Streptomyces sp. SID6673]